MAIKESSDELNSPVVTTGVGIARPSGKRSLKDYLALAIGTCGVGYFPIAPGTWGSAVGVGIYLILHWAVAKPSGMTGHINSQILFTALLLIVALVISMAGIWAATQVERLQARKDPGVVVIDEVAGQLITFLFIPVFSQWWLIVTGFFMFRLFDIWKPYPIRRLEALESGLGIMADDVLAGLYAASAVSLILLLSALR